MKKTIKILACAAVLGSVIFTGCEKDGIESHKGEAVRFSAISSGAPTTKTSYGDDESGYQIIDWLAGDLIRVYSDSAVHRYSQTGDQHWADYIIVGEGGHRDGHKSVASLTYKNLDNTASDNYRESANGLVWGESETYNFWAIYPSTDQNPDILFVTDSTVKATLPISSSLSSSGSRNDAYDEGCTYTVFAPSMKYAYMTSKASVSGSAGAVNLDFYPAFTAFEIYLSGAADEDGFSINSLSLSKAGTNNYIAGPFTMKAGDLSTVAAAEGATSSITVTFNNTVNITGTQGVAVTFFTMPITNVGFVSLTVGTTEGNATLKFTEKGSIAPYKFEAGKKYRIHLLKMGGRWMIKFGGNDMDVKPWEETSTGLIVE